MTLLLGRVDVSKHLGRNLMNKRWFWVSLEIFWRLFFWWIYVIGNKMPKRLAENFHHKETLIKWQVKILCQVKFLSLFLPWYCGKRNIEMNFKSNPAIFRNVYTPIKYINKSTHTSTHIHTLITPYTLKIKWRFYFSFIIFFLNAK